MAGWEYELARQFKSRDNDDFPVWFVGDVTSPTRSVDPETGAVTYEGPLRVSCFGGQVILGADRLSVLASAGTLYAGQRAALCGQPFSGAAGSQKVLVLGVLA